MRDYNVIVSSIGNWVSLIFLPLSVQTVKNHLSFYFKQNLVGKIFKRETGMLIMVPSMGKWAYQSSF